jgi:alpha-D-ribose 1-methylphosphonate 5-triphosphate diphosphatase PhnM
MLDRPVIATVPASSVQLSYFGTKAPAIGFYTASLAASAFRLDDRRSVKTGLRADLLIFERDPTVDITDTNFRVL